MIILDADFVRQSVIEHPGFTEDEVERFINLDDKAIEIQFEQNIVDLWWELTFDAAYDAAYELVK